MVCRDRPERVLPAARRAVDDGEECGVSTRVNVKSLGQGYALDLGTATTRIDSGEQRFTQSTALAVDTKDDRVLAVGDKARWMEGRTPERLKVLYPVQAGLVADDQNATRLLRMLLRESGFGPSRNRKWAVVCAPAQTSEIAVRSLSKVCHAVGMGKVRLLPRPLAAAIGLGIDVYQPRGALIVDIGAGGTDITIVSMGGVVLTGRSTVCGQSLDGVIARHLREQYNLALATRGAEKIKTALAEAGAPGCRLEIRGLDVATGVPRSLVVPPAELQEIVEHHLGTLAKTVSATLERAPIEIIDDICDSGLVMTGHAALLHGLEEAFRKAVGLPVHIAENPDVAAINGAAHLLRNPWLLEELDDVTIR